MTAIGETTHEAGPDHVGTPTTPSNPFWVRALRWAAAVLAVAAVVVGGRYALDRVDAAAEDNADRVTAAIEDNADRMVQALTSTSNEIVDAVNDAARRPSLTLSGCREDYGDMLDFTVSNNCYLAAISRMLNG